MLFKLLIKIKLKDLLNFDLTKVIINVLLICEVNYMIHQIRGGKADRPTLHTKCELVFHGPHCFLKRGGGVEAAVVR